MVYMYYPQTTTTIIGFLIPNVESHTNDLMLIIIIVHSSLATRNKLCFNYCWLGMMWHLLSSNSNITCYGNEEESDNFCKSIFAGIVFLWIANVCHFHEDLILQIRKIVYYSIWDYQYSRGICFLEFCLLTKLNTARIKVPNTVFLQAIKFVK